MATAQRDLFTDDPVLEISDLELEVLIWILEGSMAYKFKDSYLSTYLSLETRGLAEVDEDGVMSVTYAGGDSVFAALRNR